MATITHDDIIKLARLSNLTLNDEEVTSLQAELSKIVDYITQLGELNTEGVEPTYQLSGLSNVWREDEVGQHQTNKETLLALAPATEFDQIKVPKVLNK